MGKGIEETIPAAVVLLQNRRCAAGIVFFLFWEVFSSCLEIVGGGRKNVSREILIN